MSLEPAPPQPHTPGLFWQVRLLGGLRVTPCADDAPLPPPFRTHKAAQLFAFLALFPHRAHGREELIDRFWPDLPLDRGRANLSQTLLLLRRQFEAHAPGSVWIADHKTLRTHPHALVTDAARFEQDARAALAEPLHRNETRQKLQVVLDSYGGDLLPGFYDDWILEARERLIALREQLEARLRESEAAPPRTPSTAAVVNLPLILTRYFGREEERARLSRWLTDDPPQRLLTLVGTGGIGKTRLALEAARLVVPDPTKAAALTPFERVAFVSLADIPIGDDIGSALADILGLPRDNDPFGATVAFLNTRPDKRTLLLLDNLEQMGDTAAPAVQCLLEQIPGLTIVATSRQPIGVSGEQEWTVAPLPSVPAEKSVTLPELLAQPDARLWIDRARLARPDFTPTEGNVAALATVCRTLEGVPLALELAAAWARILTPAQIAERLGRRFDLLTQRGRGDTPKRHRSLHAAIAWSFDLLPPNLQTFWSSLAVFRGGFTLDAAQHVTGVADALEPLLLLTERSLVLAETTDDGTTRYRLLESLREFAQEQLTPTAENGLQQRHAGYFARLVRTSLATVEGTGQLRAAANALEAERENLRTAFATSLHAEPQDRAATVNCAHLALCPVRWPTINNLDWLDDALARITVLPPDRDANLLHAELFRMRGNEAIYWSMDWERARQCFEESLALYRQENDWKGVLSITCRLGEWANRQGHVEDAVRYWTECLHLSEEHDDAAAKATSHNNLGCALINYDPQAARVHLEQAVALQRVLHPGGYLLSNALCNYAAVLFMCKNYDAAEAAVREAHALALADKFPGMIAMTLQTHGEILLHGRRDYPQADNRLQAAQTIYEERGELPRIAEVLKLRFECAAIRGDRACVESLLQDYLNVRRNLPDCHALFIAAGEMQTAAQMAGFSDLAMRLAAHAGERTLFPLFNKMGE